MNKKKVCLLASIVLCLFFLCEAKRTFSQERSTLQIFMPIAQAKEQIDDGQLIQQWTERYKNSYGINELYVYKAVVLNSSTACKAADNFQACQEKMDELIALNNLAIGRCKVLKGFDQRVCLGLKKRDCSGLTKSEGLVCQALLNLDPEMLKGNCDIRGDTYDKQDVSRALAFYSAFKNGNVVSCMQIIGNDAYVYKLGCRVLLSSEPQRIIDAIASDFASYYLSTKNKKSACRDINDEYIRKYCEEGMDLSQFVERYFLGN